MSEELKKQEELGHRHGEGCGCHNDHHGEEAGRRDHDHHHGETGECHEHHHGEAGECHDRHHGEECGCHDQDHEREHHHHHESDEFPSVSVYTHDIAVVGSVKCRIDGEYEDALDKLQGCMEEAARAVEAAGGMIGHVKELHDLHNRWRGYSEKTICGKRNLRGECQYCIRCNSGPSGRDIERGF